MTVTVKPSDPEVLAEPSPYRRSLIPVTEFFAPEELGDLDPNLQITVEDWDMERSRGAETLEEAAELFERYGAVLLSPDFRIVGHPETVGEYMKHNVRDVMEFVERFIDDPTKIEDREIIAYNNTIRRMSVTRYENVMRYFPPIVQFQRDFLRTMKAIARDDTILPDRSLEEGMVINYQIRSAEIEHMSPDAPELRKRQQQGLHEDGVAFTILPIYENLGRNGNFVVVEGYEKACSEHIPPLNRHKDAIKNIALLLSENPDSLIFRRMPMSRKTVTVVNSSVTHFVSAKSGLDVQEGIAERIGDGGQPYRLGAHGKIPSRIGGNVSYNNGIERDIEHVARMIIEDLPAIAHLLRSVEPLSPETAAIVGAYCEPFDLTPAQVEAHLRKCILWGSADDLYRPELTGSTES